MNPDNQLAGMQVEIANLQQQLLQTNEALANANNTINAMQQQQQMQNVVQNTQLKCAKPDKFNGKNGRSWFVSLDNIFEASVQNINDVNRIK